jgi:beta-glucanase (GH16 family)
MVLPQDLQITDSAPNTGIASKLVPTSQFASTEAPWYVPNMVLPEDLQITDSAPNTGTAFTLIPTSQFASTDAPWYVPNMVLPQDLQIMSVREEIHRFSTQ